MTGKMVTVIPDLTLTLYIFVGIISLMTGKMVSSSKRYKKENLWIIFLQFVDIWTLYQARG